MRLKAGWAPEEEWQEARTDNRVKSFFFSSLYIEAHFNNYGSGEWAFTKFAEDSINKIAPGSRICAVIAPWDRNGWIVKAYNSSFPDVPPGNFLELVDVDVALPMKWREQGESNG